MKGFIKVEIDDNGTLCEAHLDEVTHIDKAMVLYSVFKGLEIPAENYKIYSELCKNIATLDVTKMVED